MNVFELSYAETLIIIVMGLKQRDNRKVLDSHINKYWRLYIRLHSRARSHDYSNHLHH